MDCLETKIEGLKNENTRLEISLQESKEFREIFENKNKEQKEEYQQLLRVFNENHQKQVGFEELFKDYQSRVETQKVEIRSLDQQFQQVENENGTLKVELERVNDYFNNAKSDLDDTVDRLHQTNRVRHEVELRLRATLLANEELKKTVKDKIALIG